MKTRWLVSPAYDGFFFIGSCGFTYLFYALYQALEHQNGLPGLDAVLVTYGLFTICFDHPHILQTFSRVNDEERARRPFLYTWGLGSLVGVGLFLTALGYQAQLIVFAAFYGTWHIMRQHWGLIKIYKKLNHDQSPIDEYLDSSTFFVGMFACFFNDYSGTDSKITIYGNLQAEFPPLPPATGEVVWSIFLVLLIIWGFRQIYRTMVGLPPNLPKVLLMTAALSTHYFVFFATVTPFLVAEALETVYHNIQYQGWVMHYQQRQYGPVLLRWFLVALLYGLVAGGIEVLDLLDTPWAKYAFVPFAALVLFHYHVDGLVWRVRDYPGLGTLLLSERK